MHGLEIINRINGFVQQQDHPLRLHPRIYALRLRIGGLPIGEREYASRLYVALYKYADQFIERPDCEAEEGWDDFEALQQVALEDWMVELRRYYMTENL